MRTTVTLDPDVAAKLKQLARERGVSFKEALNGSIRQGLSGAGTTPRPYRASVRRLGVRPGVDLDRVLHLAGEMEDAEIVRKLELRK
jgi:hypothetical protein